MECRVRHSRFRFGDSAYCLVDDMGALRDTREFDLIAVSEAGGDADTVRGLFLEYAQSLGFSLCFQGFDRELALLPGDYVPPRGCLLLAKAGDAAAGCVGVRPLDAGLCEMKRLYVRPAYRGVKLGRRLAEAAVAAARTLGYRAVLLDTLPAMRAARGLYASLGFTPCAAYYDNSAVGSVCLELRLEPAALSPQSSH
jgi:putative acetyltransferase